VTFGISPYGIGSYGGAVTTISIARAWAMSTRTVRVETSAPARSGDPFDAGDALNPSTWQIDRLDVLAPLTPIYVTHISGQTAFEVTIMEPLGSHLVQHRIGSATLMSTSGALITAPYQALFQGVVASIDRVAQARRRPLIRDLANPFRGDPNTGNVESSILVSGGNYVAEEDAPVVRKGIVRRITTERGAIRHLPGYGIGFRVKELVPTGGARDALRAEIERQVLQEPGVRQVRAGVDLYASGVVLIRVQARMTAAQLAVAVRRDTDGQFVEL
jgi:hypothetical protein